MAIPVPSKSLILLACISLLVATGFVVYYTSMEENAVTVGEVTPVLLNQEKDAPVGVGEAESPEVISLPAAPEILTNQVEEASDKEELLAPLSEEPATPAVAEKELAVAGPFAESPALRTQETFNVDPTLREIGRTWLDDKGQDDFAMPVTGQRDLLIEVDQFEALGREGGKFVGSVKGYPDSSVQLSYRGKAEAGIIRLPSESRIYRIYPGQNGAIVVQDRDLALDEQLTATEPPFDAVLPPVPDFIPPPPPRDLFESAPESKE